MDGLRGRPGLAALVAVSVIALAALAALAGEPTGPQVIDESGDVFRGYPAMQSCVESYTPASLSKRGFAFEGTVVTIDEGPAGAGDLNATVLFRVHHWFRTGNRENVFVGRDHVFVVMPPPTPVTSVESRPYQFGSRMLVSGEPGSDERRFMAWACGFTRWYSESDVALWRRIFRFPYAPPDCAPRSRNLPGTPPSAKVQVGDCLANRAILGRSRGLVPRVRKN